MYFYLPGFVLFQENLPRWKRACYFMCGLSDNITEEKRNSEEQKQHLKDIISLKQNPTARIILLINLVIVLCVCLFLQIYFSVPDGGPTKPTFKIPYPLFQYNKTRPGL